MVIGVWYDLLRVVRKFCLVVIVCVVGIWCNGVSSVFVCLLFVWMVMLIVFWVVVGSIVWGLIGVVLFSW